MTPDFVFSLTGPAILLGWAILIWGIVARNDWLRDGLAGRLWPLGFAAAYTLLIILFLAKSPGGFDTLANVQLLFTGWLGGNGGLDALSGLRPLHGGLDCLTLMQAGLSRLWLVLLLPLTSLRACRLPRR
ncbi:MAG: hypothetical protein U1E15_09265 [Hyphomicrobiales bacterium]